jgi:hypothetical protein
MMATGKQKRLSYAEQVLTFIPSTEGAEPISVADLSIKTGLSPDDVRDGVAMLRDVFTGESDTPLLSSPKGYVFTFDAAQNAAFRQNRAKTAHTIIRRAWHGAIKRYIASLPIEQQAEAKLITKGFERVLDDLGDLVGVGASRSKKSAGTV